jgi:hypothetical protein
MRKVVIFNRIKKGWLGELDINLLNNQIAEIEKDGWKLISVTANTGIFGAIGSFTLLIESVS